ncbi:hypothetical protein ACHAXT_012715 [Thalassiosira profunda]
MKSSSVILTLLSCVSAEAASNRPHRPTFVRHQRLSTSTGSTFNTIPRGGADGDSSSAAPDMSSLLSGMDIPGMPDMSQPPSPEQIQQSMEQFSSMLSSPQFKEMLNDPSKMEASLETMRTSLLSALEEMEKGDNPMMAMMLEQMKGQLAGSFPGGWDGLVELVNDPAKWKEMMGGLMDVMKSLGEEDMGKLMSQMAGAGMGGGMPGMGGGLPGMGGGLTGMGGDALGGDISGTLAGLDDLSEGED